MLVSNGTPTGARDLNPTGTVFQTPRGAQLPQTLNTKEPRSLLHKFVFHYLRIGQGTCKVNSLLGSGAPNSAQFKAFCLLYSSHRKCWLFCSECLQSARVCKPLCFFFKVSFACGLLETTPTHPWYSVRHESPALILHWAWPLSLSLLKKQYDPCAAPPPHTQNASGGNGGTQIEQQGGGLRESPW